MPNVRFLDATDLAALLPPAELPDLLKSVLLAAGDGVGGIEWSADAARLPAAAGKVPAGSAALLQGGVPPSLSAALPAGALPAAAGSLPASACHSRPPTPSAALSSTDFR